jgi:acylglycerol lipase
LLKKTGFLIFSLMISSLIFSYSNLQADDSFSYDKLINTPNVDLGEPSFFKASDGINIAYYLKSPAQKPVAVLLFLHGGGAHSGAGYQHLAQGLCSKYNVLVYLMDLRGHGKSGGPRGDAPTVEQVWTDLKMFIDFIRSVHKDIPIYLGGHSSGCGLILNYLSWNKKSDVDGYIFISPHFGYKSNTEKKDLKNPFAVVKMDVFIANAMSNGKEQGNTPAVYFNYSEDTLKKNPLLLKYITCNMSLSITPNDPVKQFKMIDKKFGIFIGENDELFIPEKVIEYANWPDAKIKKQSKDEIIKGETHLSILLVADELVYKIIKE